MSDKGLPPLGTKIIGKTPEGRPIVLNPDGSFSTERTATEFVDGQWRNFPTMFGGRQVEVDTAIEIMRKSGWKDPETGLPAPAFKSLDEAERDAEARSKALGAKMEEMVRQILGGPAKPAIKEWGAMLHGAP